MEMSWEYAAGAILAVGALGTAAFGIVEAFGKALVLKRFGLPFVGYPCVKVVIDQYADALRFTYGPHYERILIQQYRDGRANGRAPETIRQGVRLALPMMPASEANALVQGSWGMDRAQTTDLVAALQSENKGEGAALPEEESDKAAILAARFGLALDNRVASAFTLAEERYQSAARVSAGIAAIVLSIVFNMGLKGATLTFRDGGLVYDPGDPSKGYSWLLTIIIGAAAVPLAPIAKDLSSAMTEALKAWKQISASPKA